MITIRLSMTHAEYEFVMKKLREAPCPEPKKGREDWVYQVELDVCAVGIVDGSYVKRVRRDQ